MEGSVNAQCETTVSVKDDHQERNNHGTGMQGHEEAALIKLVTNKFVREVATIKSCHKGVRSRSSGRGVRGGLVRLLLLLLCGLSRGHVFERATSGLVLLLILLVVRHDGICL